MMNKPDIKQNNYLNIYCLFFQNERLSKPQIARLLNLSLPTVSNNIAELEAEGKIQENGVCASQGGRPATAYQLVEDAQVSIGVEIQSKSVKLAVINLKGKKVNLSHLTLTFENNLNYIAQLCQQVNDFIAEQGYTDQQILGVGIAFQGIANKDGQRILYGKILPYDYLQVETLQLYLAYPVMLLHDVKSAANAELWYSQQHIHHAVYISISEHLGGALISNNQIVQGKQGYSGAVEHFHIMDNGKQCYCGQTGCLETCCSLAALLEKNETLGEFFTKLRSNNDEVIVTRWQQFLSHLAKALKYVYLLLEQDIILGGEIAPYLVQEDIDLLTQQIEAQSPFQQEKPFIHIARLQRNATLIGAGLPFLRQYVPIGSLG